MKKLYGIRFLVICVVWLLVSPTGQTKLFASPSTSNDLIVGIPTYDCNTGQLTVTTTIGDGSPIMYQILGLRAWSYDNTFWVPPYQRQGTTFKIEVRQNGMVQSLLFTTDCIMVPNGQFVLRLPNFNCETGALALFYSNGDATPVEYRVAGLRDWSYDNTFWVPTYQRYGTTFVLEARTASGKTDKLFFTTSCNPISPPSSLPLGFGVPELNCNNGAFYVTATHTGNNMPIEFKVPGLRDWGPGFFYVPPYQRNGTTFTLYMRQSGVEYTTQYTTSCPVSTRLASAEISPELNVLVYANPIADQLKAEIQGAAQQTVFLQLTDMSGKVVQHRQVAVPTNKHLETFDLPHLSTGLYVLRVASQQKAVTVKVLKQ